MIRLYLPLEAVDSLSAKVRSVCCEEGDDVNPWVFNFSAECRRDSIEELAAATASYAIRNDRYDGLVGVEEESKHARVEDVIRRCLAFLVADGSGSGPLSSMSVKRGEHTYAVLLDTWNMSLATVLLDRGTGRCLYRPGLTFGNFRGDELPSWNARKGGRCMSISCTTTLGTPSSAPSIQEPVLELPGPG